MPLPRVTTDLAAERRLRDGSHCLLKAACALSCKMDTDGGGVVLFDEFCVWCAHRHLGAGFEEDDVGAVDRCNAALSLTFHRLSTAFR